jgi:hypothetical protein
VNLIKKLTFVCIFSALCLTVFAQNSSSPGCSSTFLLAPASGSAPKFGKFNKVLDWNHDGFQDVVSVAANGVPRISFGNGDGSFQPPVSSDYIGGVYSPLAMTVGYFDGDWIEGNFVPNNRPDIAVATEDGVYLLTSDDYGFFSFRGTPVIEQEMHALVAVDFNHDGFSDLMALDPDGGAYTSLTNGYGGFYLPISSGYTANRWDENEYPATIAAGYFDGDFINGAFAANQSPDLAVLTNRGRVFMYTTDPYGYFSLREPTIQKPFKQVISADMNGDNLTDLLGLDAEGTVWLISKQSNGEFAEPVQTSSATANLLLDGQDVDQDGNMDFAFTTKNTGALAWLKQSTICTDAPSRIIVGGRSRLTTTRTSTISSELRTFIFRP